MSTPLVKITYYLELISSWCYWAEPAWAELKSRYGNKVDFQWRLALMDASGLPVSREQCEWFYRRSGSVVRSPFMLNSGWYNPVLTEYLAPNLVAEAARDFGVDDDRVRLAICHAALREGKPVADWDVSAKAGAQAAGLDQAKLRERARHPEVAERARISTSEFVAMKATQRPTFLIESCIGDRVMISGLWKAAPIAAAIDAMLDDAAAYAAHAAHFGGPPAKA